VGHGIVVWILVPVIGDDSLSNSSIVFWLLLVKHDEDEIETREEGVWQANVAAYGLVPSILGVDGIGSSDDTASGVESGVDARLGNGDCLLLHDFVNGHTVHIVHLVELINTYNTPISKHHRTGFQMSLTCVFVNANGGGETDT
jgi:hypothetical protein